MATFPVSPVASVYQWWIELNWNRKTLLGLVSSCADKTLDKRMSWDEKSTSGCVNWRDVRMGWAPDRGQIEKHCDLWVKGQPPESVEATTVGTDQSQCHGSIDPMRTFTSILSDALAHAQYGLCSFFHAGFCRPSKAEFTHAAICRPVKAVNENLRTHGHCRSEKRAR